MCPSFSPEAFCLVYVDDILIAAKKKTDIDWFLRAMNKDWEVKDLGPISRYLGMRFTEDSQHVYIDQAPYLKALLESLMMGKCNPLSTPMVDVPFPKEKNNSPLLNVKEQSIRRSLVGRLLWVYLCMVIVTGHLSTQFPSFEYYHRIYCH